MRLSCSSSPIPPSLSSSVKSDRVSETSIFTPWLACAVAGPLRPASEHRGSRTSLKRGRAPSFPYCPPRLRSTQTTKSCPRTRKSSLRLKSGSRRERIDWETRERGPPTRRWSMVVRLRTAMEYAWDFVLMSLPYAGAGAALELEGSPRSPRARKSSSLDLPARLWQRASRFDADAFPCLLW
jgi:hypothetical protein